MDLSGKRYKVPITKTEYVEHKKMQYRAKVNAEKRRRRKLNKESRRNSTFLHNR